MHTLYTFLDSRGTMASGDLGAVKLGADMRVGREKAINAENDQRGTVGQSVPRLQTPRYCLGRGKQKLWPVSAFGDQV